MDNVKQLLTFYNDFSRYVNNICHEGILYDYIDKDNIKELFSQLSIKFKGVDFRIFSKQDLLRMGFVEIDDIMYVPSWVMSCVDDGYEFVSMDGYQIVKGVNAISMSTKGGVTLYGIPISELRNKKITDIVNEKKRL